MGAQKSMEKPQWRATALAIAAAALLGFSASDANALALGRVTVQSALGEPLRADIDIPEINAEELASLRTVIASPEAFRAAGLDYNPALSGITITLQRRPDGRHFLHLSSQRPVNEPFIDLILETQWSNGRIVRDYTMLFDPPNLRQSAPPLAAQVSPAPRAPAAQAPRATAPAATASRTPAQRPATGPAAEPRPAGGDGKQVTVQAGDTAGKIAAANKPANVSLDQMLVAMLRANPEAFIGGNVNRLKSGAVLDVPSAAEAELVPSGEARQTIVAQSRDFNEFRRRLAEGLPTTRVGGSEREASGKVQAQVEDKKPGAAAPDKLTLSKGAVQAKAAEDKIARERAAQDDATRVAELNKNITDLNKLGTAARSGRRRQCRQGRRGPACRRCQRSQACRSSPGSVRREARLGPDPCRGSRPAWPAPRRRHRHPPPRRQRAPHCPPAPQRASRRPAPWPRPLPAHRSPAWLPLRQPPSPRSWRLPAAPETSLVDDLLENPIVPATVGGVLALLLGFGFYRAQQRKKSTQVDSSFLESRLQPDSFFGASGGQRIDTNEGNATGSSMVYSPSQLDAAGDVDPVAEADVYLAYGRDLQAEEILKEAMRTTPQRVAVHGKLLEIYSKRRDAKAFELVATEAYALTRGEGPEWEHICELGQELDPSNPLYRPGGHPAEGAAAAAGAATTAPASDFGATTAAQAVPVAPASPVDLDLDLDFSLGDEEPASAASANAAQSTLAMNVPPAAEPMPSLDMDFGSPTVALESPAAAPAAVSAAAHLDAPDLNLTENSLAFTTEPPKAPAPSPVAASPAAAADAGMIEFDLGALSLDLDGPAAEAPASASAAKAAPAAATPVAEADEGPSSTAGAPLSTAGFEDTGGDPLATKLALAQEFNAIGDPDGARSLAEEVLAEASGDLKSKAQRFLAEIG